MTKKYLIDETESHTRNGFRICEECDAKEVEVLDIDKLYSEYVEGVEFRFSDHIKAYNLQIIKIKE